MTEPLLSTILTQRAAEFVSFLRTTPNVASEDYRVAQRLLKGARKARRLEEKLQFDMREEYGAWD